MKVEFTQEEWEAIEDALHDRWVCAVLAWGRDAYKTRERAKLWLRVRVDVLGKKEKTYR